MTWSYSGDPSSSSVDSVRFLIGDTDSTDEQLQNEEISWLLSENSNSVYDASIEAARALSAKYARLAVTKTVGDLKIEYQDRSKRYADLVAILEMQKDSRSVPIPYAGGISVTDKDTKEDQIDRVEPRFVRGQFRQNGVYETPHGWRD